MAHVLVTGASKGIGRAIAIELANSGQRVIGTYNTGADDCEALVNRGIEKMVPLNLLDRETSLERLRGLAKEHRFSGVVNNAGAIEFGKWPEPGLDAWDRVFAVNVTGPLMVVATLDGALENGASIVNIASTDGLIGSYASISYSASKAALINLTRSLANVFGPRQIRVNSVSPGWIDTGMSTEESMSASSLTPLGRNGVPVEVAKVVNFLVGEESAFITGANIVVDGGYSGVDYIMKTENDSL
jgi:NAD(P)-dependent dehydrogenase (short-subunit alcohol dehydrogenase family)